MYRTNGSPTRRGLATVAVLLAIVGGLWWNQHRGIKAVATETHSALCAFRHDLDLRMQSAQTFLDDVKAGRRKPVPGISNADIQQSIHNQQATLDSLETLRCK